MGSPFLSLNYSEFQQNVKKMLENVKNLYVIAHYCSVSYNTDSSDDNLNLFLAEKISKLFMVGFWQSFIYLEATDEYL